MKSGIRVMLAVAYGSVAVGYLLLAAMFLADSAKDGAIFLWISGLCVIGIHWMQTGHFWPQPDTPHGKSVVSGKEK